jgi:PhnB protein
MTSFNAYVMFDGTCRDAFTRYHEIFGGDLTLLRMGDMPADEQVDDAQADLIIHAALKVNGARLMASDDPTGGHQGVEGIHVYYEAADIPDAEKVYAALADGGEESQPLQETFFSPKWGMCRDRWGVRWMVGVAQAPS